jgi:hypothetical protein
MSENNTQIIKTVELEVVSDELAVVIKQEGLEPASAQEVLSLFSPVFAQAKNLCRDAEAINVTDATQVTQIKQARALRLLLRGIRVEADKIRKKLKEDSLRRGKAIQGVYNIIEYAIAPVEERLLEHEKFAERAEAARIAKAKEEREAQLSAYVADLSFYRLGEMSEEAWKQLLSGAKAAHEARISAEVKAEQERIAQAMAEAEERERVRQENERLKREVSEREAALRAEREAAEAKARAEAEKARKEREAVEARARAEREKIERKAAAEREAAEKKVAAEHAAREKAEAELRAAREERDRKAKAEVAAKARAGRAPDRQKLKVLAGDVRKLPVPSASTDEGRAVIEKIKQQVEKFALWIEAQGEGLA